MPDFSFNSTRSIVNQWGGISDLASHCLRLGIQRPLVITDAGIVSAGLLAAVEEPLHKQGLAPLVFAEVIADPPEHIIHQALQQGREASIDGVIGFGGGSSMDTAKLVALLLRTGAELDSVYGVDQAQGDRLPLILIPTTAGTGSEVTAVAIVTTGETTKSGVVANQLYPDVALLDAELTLGLPSYITAATGIDAMVHAIEAYTSVQRKNPYSDMLAREALHLMANNLATATHDGGHREARSAMLLGACLAGQAFANAPVAAVHALAYPLGGHYHIPHGLSNSLVLPHVLGFNASHAAPWYAEIADLIVPGAAGSDAQKSDQLQHYFVTLIAELGLPARLSALDVPEADLPMLAADAMLQQRLLVNNPRPVQEADALAIYRSAW